MVFKRRSKTDMTALKIAANAATTPSLLLKYTFFRAVKTYGAIGDCGADDTAAINRAIPEGERCGLATDCSSTTTALGASSLYYHPPSTLILPPLTRFPFTIISKNETRHHPDYSVWDSMEWPVLVPKMRGRRGVVGYMGKSKYQRILKHGSVQC